MLAEENMNGPGFLPRRVKGVDSRQKAIFDNAASLAKAKEFLVSDSGAAASWYFRRKGLHIAVSSRIMHGYGSHSFDVRIRWRRQTVFQAVFHQRLFGRGKDRCGVQMYEDFAGEWEALLAEFCKKE